MKFVIKNQPNTLTRAVDMEVSLSISGDSRRVYVMVGSEGASEINAWAVFELRIEDDQITGRKVRGVYSDLFSLDEEGRLNDPKGTF